MYEFKYLQESDPEVAQSVTKELERQKNTLNMIPSENTCTKSVLAACGTVLNNKYAEGYPGKRYYQGNEYIDEVEQTAIDRAKKLFNAEHANVQPDSGSIANAAAYFAVLKPGDKIMGMRLDMGGHLTHGHSVNMSARFYTSTQYSVDKETELMDMNEIRKLALAEKPKIIVSGATAYPRIIDFKQFKEIADEVGAYCMADISHIAGLIAGGAHPSPFPFTDIVTSTTHKTLRGPRSAIIFSKQKDDIIDISQPQFKDMSEKQLEKQKSIASKIDSAVFPGLQGGPHEHIIAAKAVAFKEAATEQFKDYAHQIVKNAKALAETLTEKDIRLVSGGTDNHLMLIDLTPEGIGLGKEGAVALEDAGICTNCNTVPYDQSTPFRPSGIRIGTPILTTRGMKEPEMKQIGEWISKVLKNRGDKDLKEDIRKQVKAMCDNFVFY